jgi:hypothetical protein
VPWIGIRNPGTDCFLIGALQFLIHLPPPVFDECLKPQEIWDAGGRQRKPRGAGHEDWAEEEDELEELEPGVRGRPAAERRHLVVVFQMREVLRKMQVAETDGEPFLSQSNWERPPGAAAEEGDGEIEEEDGEKVDGEKKAKKPYPNRRRLREAVAAAKPGLGAEGHQDAQEAFSVLIDALEACGYEAALAPLRLTIIMDEVKCIECGSTHGVEARPTFLGLALEGPRVTSLSRVVADFVRTVPEATKCTEILGDGETRCGGDRTKKTTITRWPETLIVYLQRFGWGPRQDIPGFSGLIKNLAAVALPLKWRPIAEAPQYDCVATLAHDAPVPEEPEYGHYTVRAKRGRTWTELDDKQVRNGVGGPHGAREWMMAAYRRVGT